MLIPIASQCVPLLNDNLNPIVSIRFLLWIRFFACGSLMWAFEFVDALDYVRVDVRLMCVLSMLRQDAAEQISGWKRGRWECEQLLPLEPT